MEYKTLKEFIDKNKYMFKSFLCNKECKKPFELKKELIDWNNSSLIYNKVNQEYEISIKLLKKHC